MLFSKKIPKSCVYCVHGTKLDENQILCIKKGVVAVTDRCIRFTYDPCKRIPLKKKALDFSKYDEEDYTI